MLGKLPLTAKAERKYKFGDVFHGLCGNIFLSEKKDVIWNYLMYNYSLLTTLEIPKGCTMQFLYIF